MASDDRVPVDGTERAPSGPFVKKTRASRIMDVTVLLRESTPGMLANTLENQGAGTQPHIAPDEFAASHGARDTDRAALSGFARQHGLEISDTMAGGRAVKLSGTESQLAAAFGVTLGVTTSGGGVSSPRTSHRTARGPISLPEPLAGAVLGVYGFDKRPIAHPRLTEVRPRAASSGQTSYDPPDVAKLYNFPQIDGTGVTIGIIELGGTVSDADLTKYFASIGVVKPTVIHVAVDGQAPVSDPGGANVEVALDVEVIGGMAPGCTIVIYDAPNTEQGFIDAILAAAHDDVNNPSVVSISWGAPEIGWSAAGMRGMDEAFAIGSAMGVTYTAAAGDNGSTDGVGDGRQHADHPASSPHVVACGGTTMLGRRGVITTEVAWGGAQDSHGATGGGVSEQFSPEPDYQDENAVHPVTVNPRHTRGRGVPDVAGVADPVTGMNVLSDGRMLSVGGTSSVSPQWAALFGLTVKALGHRLGFVNPLLYSAAPNSFNEVVGGDNGAYQAGGRWSPVVGLGSPNGANLVTNLVMPSPAVALKGRRVGSGAGQPRPVAPGPKVVDDGQQVA